MQTKLCSSRVKWTEPQTQTFLEAVCSNQGLGDSEAGEPPFHRSFVQP